MDFFPLGVGLTSLFCWALLSNRRIAEQTAFEAAQKAHRACGDGTCAPTCPLASVAIRYFTNLLLSAVQLAKNLPPLSCSCTLQQEGDKARAADLLKECTRGLQALQQTRVFAKVRVGVSPVVGFYMPQLKVVEMEDSLQFLLDSVLLPNDVVKLGPPNGTFAEADSHSPHTGPIPATPHS